MTTAPRDLSVVQVPICDLVLDPANPRQIDPADLDALTHSVQRYGVVQPIVARTEDRLVIGGH